LADALALSSSPVFTVALKGRTTVSVPRIVWAWLQAFSGIGPAAFEGHALAEKLKSVVLMAVFVTDPRLCGVWLPHWIEALNEPLAPFAALVLAVYVR
jgi:hypothetical protein